MLLEESLTLKAPSIICSRRHSKFFFYYFLEETSLDISCELSAKQTIHMKCQDLFSLKKKIKKKLSSAAVVIGALRVKEDGCIQLHLPISLTIPLFYPSIYHNLFPTAHH